MVRIDAVHRLAPAFGPGAGGAEASPAPAIGVLTVERALGGGVPGGGGTSLGAAGSTLADPGAPARAARPVRMDAIILSTCAAMGVEQVDLGGKTRHPRVVLARAIITHLARQMTTLSYPEIARAIGRPNHSTVITAIQRFAKQLEADQAVEAPGAPEARTLSVLVAQIAQSVNAQAARR
jgi:chromosomal replication initiator protein